MKYFKYLFFASLFLSFIGVGSSGFIEASAAIDETPTPSPTPKLGWYGHAGYVPEEVKYWTLFREIQTLKERDAENQLSGSPTEFVKSFYENRLALANSQFAAMNTISADCMTQLQPIEQRAREVITEYRSAYPNGELKKRVFPPPSRTAILSVRPERSYELLPPVPSELTQLQTQKNQMLLDAKERLRQAFGTSAFAAFEGKVTENWTRILVPLDQRPKQLPPLPAPAPSS